MAQLNLHCPLCGQVDLVQKVSIIAEGDVTQRYGEYGTYTYPTDLARSLSRPSKPTRSSSPGCGFVVATILSILGGAGLIQAKSSEVMAFSGLFLVFGILLCIASFSGTARENKEYEDKLALWTKETEKWDQLYYCRRDGAIFNPQDPESGSMAVPDMKQYLNGNAPHPQQKETEIRARIETYGIEVLLCPNCQTFNSLSFVNCIKCQNDLSNEKPIPNPYLET